MGHGVVEQAVALLWGGEERRVGELVDPAYRDHAAVGPDLGPEAFLAERRNLRRAFADAVVIPEQVVLAGSHVAVRLRFRGLHVGPYAGLEPSGRTVEWQEIHLWATRDGRLVEHWAGRGDLAALRRLGATLTWTA